MNFTKDHLKSKAVFAGAIYNCASYLPTVLKNIEKYAGIFSESAFIFVENDSSDGTKEILRDWISKQKNCTLICLDGLILNPIRTVRLEIVRNSYIEFIKSDEKLLGFDYLVLMDMDNVGAQEINAENIKESLVFLEMATDNAAIFANQQGVYYDLWALRHPQICPDDVWEEMVNRVLINNEHSSTAFDSTFINKIFSIPTNMEMIEVESAFGGFGIYKLSYVLKNNSPYLGSKVKIMRLGDKNEARRLQVCEHVHFNRGIRNIGGRLFINPRLINGVNPSLNLNQSVYKTLLF